MTVMNAALDRIEAILDEPELPDTGKQHLPAQAQPGQPEVQFNDVAFAYQDKEVLHRISFAMKKNSMTALVGPSGGGKSTIANLLARLWDVKSGSVCNKGRGYSECAAGRTNGPDQHGIPASVFVPGYHL